MTPSPLPTPPPTPLPPNPFGRAVSALEATPRGAARIRVLVQYRRGGAVIAQRQFQLDPGALDPLLATDAAANLIGHSFGVRFDNPYYRRGLLAIE